MNKNITQNPFVLTGALLLMISFASCKKYDGTMPNTGNDTLAKYYGMSVKHRKGVQVEYDSVTNTTYQHYINDSTYYPDTLLLIKQGADDILFCGKVIIGPTFVRSVSKDSNCFYYTQASDYRNYQYMQFFNHYDSVSSIRRIYTGSSYYVQTSYSFDCRKQQ